VFLLTGRRLAFVFLLGGASTLFSQANPTASRAGDLQIGAGFAIGKPDYVQNTFYGITAYAGFDFTGHLGVEADFHQIDTSTSDQSYQRTYEIGARYFRTYGPAVPYAKIMIGRGDFNYPHGLADLSYNLFAAGAGADLKLSEHFRLRGEYEFQKWSSFPNGGLTPQLFTIGAAYHFTGARKEK
jgi:opacity protein-like surface antigen